MNRLRQLTDVSRHYPILSRALCSVSPRIRLVRTLAVTVPRSLNVSFENESIVDLNLTRLPKTFSIEIS